MFISVKVIDFSSNIAITIPVVDRNELRKRINDFIKKRDSKYLTGIEHSHLYKKLFQDNFLELAAFPQRKLDRGSISCGDLLVCALSPEKGFVLCFIPSTEKPSLRSAEMIKQFQGKNYPNCSEASTCLLSKAAISFLACEEGMINVDTSGSCMLQGLEIFLLRYKNIYQNLLCRKLLSNLLIQSPSYIMGEVNSDYLLVDCVCREKNFCFKVGLPIFSQKEVSAKIYFARQAHAVALNESKKYAYLRFVNIFSQVSSTHHVTRFPPSMFLNLPFGFIEGGQLLFSQEEKDGTFKCVIISDLFVSGKQQQIRHPVNFHDWQIGSPSYIQTTQSTKNITCFSDSSVKVVRKKGSKQFFVVGAQVKLICNSRGIWGICFFRESASSFDLQSEETTLIPCTKKKQNLVMEQGPSHSAQSSLDCDPEEGPFQGATKRSAECSLGLHFSDQDFLWSSVCDPEETPFQSAKKRSTEYLGLHFTDQNALWNPRWNLEEETSQDAKNRSKKCLGLKCIDQDPLWSAASNSPSSKDK